MSTQNPAETSPPEPLRPGWTWGKVKVFEGRDEFPEHPGYIYSDLALVSRGSEVLAGQRTLFTPNGVRLVPIIERNTLWTCIIVHTGLRLSFEGEWFIKATDGMVFVEKIYRLCNAWPLVHEASNVEEIIQKGLTILRHMRKDGVVMRYNDRRPVSPDAEAHVEARAKDFLGE